jgi:hypothetical protein
LSWCCSVRSSRCLDSWGLRTSHRLRSRSSWAVTVTGRSTEKCPVLNLKIIILLFGLWSEVNEFGRMLTPIFRFIRDIFFVFDLFFRFIWGKLNWNCLIKSRFYFHQEKKSCLISTKAFWNSRPNAVILNFD